MKQPMEHTQKHPDLWHRVRLGLLATSLCGLSACSPSTPGLAPTAAAPIEKTPTMPTPTDNTPTPQAIPIDSHWTLRELNGQAVTLEQKPTLSWSADQRISGMAGCNRYFGASTGSAQQLRIEGVGMTKMACADDAMALEIAFVKALEAARGWRLEGHTLTFDSASGQALLRFERSKG